MQLTKLASDYKFIVEDIQAEEVGANGLADKNIKEISEFPAIKLFKISVKFPV